MLKFIGKFYTLTKAFVFFLKSYESKFLSLEQKSSYLQRKAE